MNFLNYSGSMDADLKVLEQKLSHLISMCNALRGENAELRLSLNKIEADTAALKANMAQASERIETLIDSLP
jgi:cell division protein ZapB